MKKKLTFRLPPSLPLQTLFLWSVPENRMAPPTWQRFPGGTTSPSIPI